MQEKSVLISFLAESYYRQLDKNLTRYIRKNNAADLHKARVNIKKLRSLIQFAVESGVPGKWKKYDKILGKIFRKAGKVRDMHVCKAMLINSGMEAKYFLKAFNKKYTSAIRECRNVTKQYLPRIKKVKHKLSRKEIYITTDFLQRYVAQCKDRLHMLLAISSSNDYWHDIRKEIKKILYAIEWSDAESFPVQPELVSLYMQMDVMAGEWNNEKVLLAAIINEKDVENIRKELQLRIHTLEKQLIALANVLSA